MYEPVRETRQMLAGLNPVLDEEEVVFCTTTDTHLIAEAQARLGWFREREGASLILPRGVAERLGFPVSLPMRRIVLEVNSALDGVGLTAAVSAALAAESIPCNMVAAYHHDHVFAPSAMAERALAVLKALQAEAVGQRQAFGAARSNPPIPSASAPRQSPPGAGGACRSAPWRAPRARPASRRSRVRRAGRLRPA